MNLENIRENQKKVILQFSVPSIIAMVLTSMITGVDGFFIGNYVGKEGIAAINLGLPIIYLFLAVGLMVSVGGVAIAGMSLGAGKIKNSNNVFSQTIFTTLIFSVALSVIMYSCFNPMLNLLNAEGYVRIYFRAYYLVMLLELPVMVINASLGMFIRGDGNPEYFMRTNIITFVVNIALDYLFVRWFGLGCTGVAVASLIAATIALIYNIYFFLKKSQLYKFNRFIFSKYVLKSTVLNGASEFIGEISLCISMFSYNYVIMTKIGVDGVTAFTIVGYVAYVFSMIIIGFGQGATPLMSFTHGAKEFELAKNIRKNTNLFVFLAGIIVILIMLISCNWYSNLLIKNEEIEFMVSYGMRIYIISFLFSGINTITSFYFTSIGNAKYSAIISSLRGFIVLLICIYTLPIWLKMTGIWLVAPITEGMTIIVSLIFILKDRKCKNTLVE